MTEQQLFLQLWAFFGAMFALGYAIGLTLDKIKRVHHAKKKAALALLAALATQPLYGR